MIDQMIRCKNLNPCDKIETIHEWFYKCPPKGKEKQWKDGRSAKETAKHWVHTIPQPFIDILKDKHLNYELCSPEYVTKFDAYKGEGRNHDLLILAKNVDNDNVVISIESKADEPFGDNLEKTKEAAKKAKDKNNKSKALERIKELRVALFGEENDNQDELMYQLLTAVAGTIAEAKKQDAKSAFFLVQTFVEKENSKHITNKEAFNRFLKVFTKSEDAKIENNEVLGPFRIATNNEYLSSDIDLWIGKYGINI
ncbi:DUF6946 family protein [Flavobacterium sp. XGLA_31]|uniref:DUF6946 family protein n=1 Tax=Flavobacterium sp. XGLA_31 TaxID=3447666 RepID=UPI003F356760